MTRLSMIGHLSVWASVPCEVFNRFSGLIPQTGLAMIEISRQYQATARGVTRQVAGSLDTYPAVKTEVWTRGLIRCSRST